MITSIVLTGTYKIGISESGKIKTPDGVRIDTKDIPFVRYRFSKYGDEELRFIEENKKTFNCVHVLEITLDSETASLLEKIEETDDTLGRLVYVPITDKHVEQGFDDNELNLIRTLIDSEFDRIIIKDNSRTLHGIALNRLKKQIKDILNIPEKEIGVCGGACCFIDGNACLTAVRAREMLAKYSERDDIVVPSANHEGKLDEVDEHADCVNKCGCIRYHIFNSDMPAPSSKSGVKKSSEGTKKQPERKEKFNGYIEIDW